MEKNDFISEIVVFKPSQGSNEFEIILDGENDTYGFRAAINGIIW